MNRQLTVNIKWNYYNIKCITAQTLIAVMRYNSILIDNHAELDYCLFTSLFIFVHMQFGILICNVN